MERMGDKGEIEAKPYLTIFYIRDAKNRLIYEGVRLILNSLAAYKNGNIVHQQTTFFIIINYRYFDRSRRDTMILRIITGHGMANYS